MAEYAANPDNAASWYADITEVEWETTPPVDVGSKVAFVATFRGRTLRYTCEVELVIPDERFVMGTAGGPFPWRRPTRGGTHPRAAPSWNCATGEPKGFSKLSAPLMRLSMRRATTKDLRRLKEILEAPDDV